MVVGGTNRELHEQLKTVTAELNQAVDAFTSQGGNGNRQKLISAAEKILSTARDPSNQWMDDAFETGRLAATHLFQVWDGFAHIPEEGSISFSELAQKLAAEVSLVERIVGVLMSLGTLQAVGTDRVAHTPKSRILLPGNQISILYRLVWDNATVPFFHLEDYFNKYGRKEPQTINHIPSTFAHGCPEKPFFEFLAEDPAYLQRFMVGMNLIESQAPVSGIYNFTWLVEKAKQEPERVAFVDVGGGRGHAILAIHDEFPGLPLSQFVLQDRPETIAAVKAEGRPTLDEVQKMPIDFHISQPITGAMVYFIRRCLHNYGDTLCTNILKILANAMADDSKILIQEDIRVVPPDPKSAYLDFLMITYGGKARTLQCWEDILEQAGLEISGISSGDGPWQSLSVIECVKKGLA